MLFKKVGWKETPNPMDMDLEVAAKEIAAHLDEDCTVEVSPHQMRVRIGKTERRVSNWDLGYRLILWLCALTVLQVARGVERSGVMPDQIGLLVAGLAVSAVGLLCRLQLDSSRDSRVVEQLLRAKSRAVSFNELACDALVAAHALVYRPWGALPKSLLKNWWAQDNNFEKAVTEPVREALILLTQVKVTKGEIAGDWGQKNLYDGRIGVALDKAEPYKAAWFRSVFIPTVFLACIFGACLLLLAGLVGGPILLTLFNSVLR